MKARRRWFFFIPVAAIAITAATCQAPIKKTPPEVNPAPPGENPCATPAVGLVPFTQDELDSNWGPDRQFPSGGVTSVSFGGCDNVAELGIDSTQTQTGTFQRTEGIKNPPATAGNFGTAVEINLYLDPAWQGTAVRAGLWVVGDNGSGARDEIFGIVEFTNIEPITSGADLGTNAGDHEGWRFWDGSTPWQESAAGFTYGEWVTIRIELDPSAQEYNYFVNGALIGTVGGGEHFIREVFINQYNFGLHTFENLNSDSYAGHWFAGV